MISGKSKISLFFFEIETIKSISHKIVGYQSKIGGRGRKKFITYNV
jgi:hypothetical protein